MRLIKKKLSLFTSLLLAGLFSMVCAAVQSDENYRIVVHPEVSDELVTKNALRAIIGMRLNTWPDGTAIRVFVMRDDDPMHIAFSKEALNILPHQLRLAWDRLVFSGTGQAPIEVSSQAEMLNRIAGTRGAIGYLQANMVDDSVRILDIK